MSELSEAIGKIAENVKKTERKGVLDVTEKLAPFIIALVSLVVSVFFAMSDRGNKVQAMQTAQMDAVSKVLPYLSDSDSRKNLMGLMMLTNFGQDSLAIRLIQTDFFDKNTITKASLYILNNSNDTTSIKDARSLLSSNEIALQNAISELKQNYKGNDAVKAIKKYNDASNLQECEEWATPFIYWCFNKEQKRLNYIGGAEEIEKAFFQNGWTYSLSKTLKPESGDIYFYYQNFNKKRFIGIVEKYDEKSGLSGIEGTSYDSRRYFNGDIIFRNSFDNQSILNHRMVFARFGNSFSINTGSYDCANVAVTNCTTGEGFGSPCSNSASISAQNNDSISIIIYYHNNGLAPAENLSFKITDVRNKAISKNGIINATAIILVNGEPVAGGIVAIKNVGTSAILKLKSITNYIPYLNSNSAISNEEDIFRKEGYYYGKLEPGWNNQGMIKCTFLLQHQ